MAVSLRRQDRNSSGTAIVRWLLVCFAVGVPCSASAADFSWPWSSDAPAKSANNWGGFYAGGQYSYSSTKMDFDRAFNSSNIFSSSNGFSAPLGSVSTWARPGLDSPSATNFGGFIGYDTVWEDAVLGIELNYQHLGVRGSGSAARCYSTTNVQCPAASVTMGDSLSYDVNINAQVFAHLTDYGTIKGRAGWTYGSILPYVTFGLALGRVETSRSATANGYPTGSGNAFSITESDGGTHYKWGYTLGGGLDFMVISHVFLRAEYEFTQLNDVLGSDLPIHTGRVGIGVKF